MNLKRLAAWTTAWALVFPLSVPSVAAANTRFSDVPEDFWGYEDITRMAAGGYAKGYEDGTFKPNGKMTAAETLLFCARATGIDASTQSKIAADRKAEMNRILPADVVSWAASEMAVALETGTITDIELEKLADAGALTKTISREDICLYLVRAMQLEPLTKKLVTYALNYSDRNDISANLQPYVYVLTNFGILRGTENGTFEPKSAVTRAQMTTMLCRALDVMKRRGIYTELSEYTTYDWAGGTISAVTPGSNQSVTLTLTSEVNGTNNYTVPASANIYEDNMLADKDSLNPGDYVRLNLTSGGRVQEARISGRITTYTGTVGDLNRSNELTLQTNDGMREFQIDRFTAVKVGDNTGNRDIIDYAAAYTNAACGVDSNGHLAWVQFSGGSQLTDGLVESVVTKSGETTIGVTRFNGVVFRYPIPTGASVMIDGSSGTPTEKNVGDFIQVRLDNDTGAAKSFSIDTRSEYIQGPIQRVSSSGSTKAVTVTDIFRNKRISYNVNSNAEITYDGKQQTVSQIKSGWYITARIEKDLITKMEAYPASSTVTGELSNIVFGGTTRLEITRDDGSIAVYNLDVTALPTITRNRVSSSLDQLHIGDNLELTIRYNKVEKIDATPRSANLTGIVSRVTLDAESVTIDVTFQNGTAETYSASNNITITQNGSLTTVYSLKPGCTVALVTNGDTLLSIDIVAQATEATQTSGTVLMVNDDDSPRTITLLVQNTLGQVNPIVIQIARNATLVDLNNATLDLEDFRTGDIVVAYGGYNNSTFVATILIRQQKAASSY